MIKNKYYFSARLAPALLTSIPVIVLANRIILDNYSVFKEISNILPLIAHLGFSTATIFLAVQINRLIAKEIFQRLYFKDELYMPTTNHLMLSDRYYETSIKEKIRNKIKEKFDVVLFDQTEESADPVAARKLISSSVSQIRIALRENKQLLRHNIEYGFFRNLVGGSLIAVLFSVATYFYGHYVANINLKLLSIVMVIVYLIPILLSKLVIKRYGIYYSKILYEEFMGI